MSKKQDECGSCHKPQPKCTCTSNGKGAKFDKGKLDWTILPIECLDGVAKIMMFGSQKYARENWKTVPDGINRYKQAMWRHYMAIEEGEEIDPDSGMPHWDHFMCNAMFITWFIKQQRN